MSNDKSQKLSRRQMMAQTGLGAIALGAGLVSGEAAEAATKKQTFERKGCNRYGSKGEYGPGFLHCSRRNGCRYSNSLSS